MHEGIKYVCPYCLYQYNTEAEVNLCYLADKGWIDRISGEEILGESNVVANMAKTGWLRKLIGL